MLIAFSLCTLVSSVLASNNYEESRENDYQVLSVVEDSGGKTISVSINEPTLVDVGPNAEYMVAEYPQEGFIDIPTQPFVPVIGRMVRLPISGGAHIEILDSHYNILDNIEYAAFFGEGLPEELTGVDASVDMWFPEEVVTIDHPAILKDFRVAHVSTYPIQVNPMRRQVRVYDRLQYRITYDQSTDENSLDVWPAMLSETFVPFYTQLLDWNQTELDQYELYRGAVQLICQSDRLDLMESWIEWKKQKGWDVQIITDADVAWNNDAIKSELQNRYDASDTKFDHIVIVGDASGAIWTPHGSSGDYYGAGDHDYGLLAGDDQLLDASIGRISVETSTQLVAYIRKVISYEKNTNTENVEWYKHGSVAAGSATSGISTVFLARYTRDLMIEKGYTQVDTAFYNDGQGAVNDRIINQINNGVGFHLYRGYLGSGLTNDQINALNNINMLPVVIDITCGRGNWANDTSINETYMRAGNVNSPKGAIGAMSTATIGTHTRYNNALAGGGVDAVFEKKTPTLGQMLLGAKFNLWQNFNGFAAQEDYIQQFNQWLNLMGDPTVWIFTDIPDYTINFDIPDQIELGTNGLEISVVDNDGPLENAWVTFYKSDQQEEVIKRAVTDSNGNVFLDILCNNPGYAIVTVTAHNYRPVQHSFEIVTPANLLGIIGHAVLDDGTIGTSGNGNGIAEAGETVGLLLTLHNYGQSTETDISLTASSSDENIVSVSGNPLMTSLDPGEEAELLDPLLLDIGVNAPDDWIAVLDVNIDGSDGDYTDKYGLSLAAPLPVFMESTGLVLPGEQGTVSFSITNIGGADLENSTLSLETNDPHEDWITIETGEGTLGPIEVGTSATTSEFTLTGSEEAYNGYSVNCNLIIETTAGRVQNVPVKIQMGNKSPTDPEGPDGYGYFAYDQGDNSYIMRPAYEWIEIDPDEHDVRFDGIELPLDDDGEDQDVAVAIDLPFDFTYYGETYTTITICSNGWVAMGDQEGIALNRNWCIPSPIGPSAMIAPYWDDLVIPGDESGVFTYDLQEKNVFVIEWNNLTDIIGRYHLSFQLILLENSEDFMTPTGDNEFIFNYKEINPSTGDHSDVPYWTTGIENASQQDGLQLSYYNIPSSGTLPIEDNRCIMVSTRTTFPTGVVNGTVTLSGDNTPIEDVFVSADVRGNADSTDSNGNYTISLKPGAADIIFEKFGFNPVVVEDVIISEDGIVTVDVQMSRPVFSMNPDTLIFNMEQDDNEVQSLIIENIGDAELTYEMEVIVNDPDVGDNGNLGSVYQMFDLPYDNNIRYLDLESQGDTLWVMHREYDGFETYISLYDLEGNELGNYRLPFMNDLTRLKIYGDILVLGTMDELRFCTYTDHLVVDSTKALPAQYNVSDFAVDYVNEKIYFAQSEYLTIFDFDMQPQRTHVFDESVIFYGLDISLDDPDGNILHLAAHDWLRDDPNCLFVFNVGSDTEELVLNSEIVYRPMALSLIGRNNNTSYLAGIMTGSFPRGIVLYNYISYLDWVNINRTNGIIGPQSSESVNVAVSTEGLENGTYNAWLSIEHNAEGGLASVPLILNVGTVGVENKTKIPQEWVLDKIYPNPFNPVATVKFSLLENVAVNARLYNILGQQVAELVNRPMQAGQHTLTINGENLSSGIYFLKFNAGPLSSVQKVVLVK